MRAPPRIEGRGEVRLDPVDARGVLVGAPELGAVRLRQEVPQGPARSASEVQHPLVLEGPPVRQQAEQRLLGLSAHLLIGGDGIAELIERADAAPPPTRRGTGGTRLASPNGGYGWLALPDTQPNLPSGGHSASRRGCVPGGG